MYKPKWKTYDSWVIALLTIYTFCLLAAMDFVLESFISAYQPVGSTWLGTLIFFLVSHVFLYFFQHIRTDGYLVYYLAGLSLFFPLVLLASILRVFFGFSADGFASYAEVYCDVESASREICGEAFAFIVFSMTIRALPVVITIPLLYRWIYLVRPVVKNEGAQ